MVFDWLADITPLIQLNWLSWRNERSYAPHNIHSLNDSFRILWIYYAHFTPLHNEACCWTIRWGMAGVVRWIVLFKWSCPHTVGRKSNRFNWYLTSPRRPLSLTHWPFHVDPPLAWAGPHLLCYLNRNIDNVISYQAESLRRWKIFVISATSYINMTHCRTICGWLVFLSTVDMKLRDVLSIHFFVSSCTIAWADQHKRK